MDVIRSYLRRMFQNNLGHCPQLFDIECLTFTRANVRLITNADEVNASKTLSSQKHFYHFSPPIIKDLTSVPLLKLTLASKISNPTQSAAPTSAAHQPHSAHPYHHVHSSKSRYPVPSPSSWPAQPHHKQHVPTPKQG